MAFTTLKDLGIDSPYKKEKYDNFIENTGNNTFSYRIVIVVRKNSSR